MEFSQRIRRQTSTTKARDEAADMRDGDWYETHGQGD